MHIGDVCSKIDEKALVGDSMKIQYDSALIRKEFFRLLPLQILVTMIMSINGIIDGLVASNIIGASAVAVVGLFNPIVKIMDTVSVVIMSGSQILCGKYMGENASNRITGIYTMNLTAVSGVSAVMTLGCMLFPGTIAGGLGANADLMNGLRLYILGIAPGFIPAMISSQLSAFMQLQHKEKRTYFGIVCMAVINAGLDVFFVSGMGWGMFGLGLATSLGNFAFAAVLGILLLLDRQQSYWNLKMLKLSDLKAIFCIGFPGAVAQFCQVLRALMLNYLIVMNIGNDAAAAFGVINVYSGILFAVTSGLSSAVRILVSIYQGEKDRTSLSMVMQIALGWGIALELVSFLVIALFSGVLTGIFYRPTAGALYTMTRFGLIMFAASMIFSGIYLIVSNYHQCFGRIGFVNLLAVMDGAVSVCVLSGLLVPHYGMNGIWYAQLLNGVVTLALILGYSVLKSRCLPKSVDELILLPRDFGVSADDRMSASVRSMDEVEGMSQKAFDFCIRHGMDSRRSMYASLCLEEMAGNIVDHGFRDHRKHSIDIRVIYSEEKLLLRIRDDAVPFDPVAYEKLFSSEDICCNIGLRMVFRIAGKTEYQNMLGLNVLTIEL